MEFATCAVNRPEILDITYSTLIKHLKGVDFSKSILYINIDPTPTSKNLHKVEEVAKKYFGKVITNYPKLSRYSRAFKWVVSQPKGEYFLYIEDDWKFIKDFHINQCINQINKSNNIKFVSINNGWTHKNKNPQPIICTTPSFYDNKFIKKILPNIKEIGTNAEHQMRKIGKIYNVAANWLSDNNVYYCIDLGVEWTDKKKIPQSDIHIFCYYNLCDNCEKHVPIKKFYCDKCRRRWCSKKCMNENLEYHKNNCYVK